eukprot:PhF_6_TR1952/c0_g2_i1/m.3151/K10297/FBXO11; F-box protein 11
MQSRTKRKSPLGTSGGLLTIHETSKPGAFTSLQEALEHAKPNDRIELSPGVYEESHLFTLNATYDIYCETGTAKIMCYGMIIKVDMYLEGIELVYTGSAPDREYGVLLQHGKLTMTGCTIPSLYAEGSSSLLMSQCTVAGSMTCGVFLSEHSKAEIRTSVIKGHAEYGVVVETTEPCLLFDNKFSEADSGQLYIGPDISQKPLEHEPGLVTLRGNQFEDIGVVKVVPPPPPGEAAAGKRKSVVVHIPPAQQLPPLRSAITIQNGANVLLERNHIRDCIRHGVVVDHLSKASFDRNQIMSNKGIGIFLDGTTHLVDIRSNSFHENEMASVALQGMAVARISGSDFGGKGKYAVLLSGKAKLNVKDTAFRRGNIGLHAQEQSDLKMKDCQLEGMECGVSCEGMSSLLLDSSNFTDSTCCVKTQFASRGKITGSRFVINRTGIQISEASLMTVVDNEFKGNEYAVDLSYGAKGMITRNQFLDGRGADVCISKLANPIVTDNTFSGGGKGHGIYCKADGRGVIQFNRIADTGKAGIRVDSNSDPYVENNIVTGSMQEGILVCDEGRGTFVNNLVTNNSSGGAVVKTRGNPVFRNNTFTTNSGVGIEASLRGSGVYEKNFVTTENIGIMLKQVMLDGPVFRGNVLEGTQTGILCTEKGSGTLRQNVITRNLTGIQIESESNPIVIENRIESNTDGIVVSRGGLGIIC